MPQKIIVFLIVLASLFQTMACHKKQNSAQIRLDGSSTVFPISEAIAEAFQKENRGSRVTIGISGTGGGFKKFCLGHLAITQASRPITEGEKKHCQENKVEYIELPIAYDGIVVAVHPQNMWVDSLTVEELKTLWRPEAQEKITKWNQVRSTWPSSDIHLFAPGVDSGTYDYFTQVIVGKEHASRGDVTSSEDDNVLVQGISMDKMSLGFFGFAYYAENKDKLKVVSVNGVTPSFETILNTTYEPLSRPIFIYVDKKKVNDPEINKFMSFYLDEVGKLSKEVGYIPLSEQVYGLVKNRFNQRIVGSIFQANGLHKGSNLEQLLNGRPR